MAQLTLYLDDETDALLACAASASGLSTAGRPMKTHPCCGNAEMFWMRTGALVIRGAS
jgi:hypothetical protein